MFFKISKTLNHFGGNPETSGSQMVTPNSGGKILKSGGGDYDDIDEFYPEINEGEDTMILKSLNNTMFHIALLAYD